MRNVQTQRLDNRIALFEIKREVLVLVGGKKLSCVLQLLYIVDAVGYLLFCYLGIIGVFLQHGGDDLLSAAVLEHCDHVIGEIIHYMDAAAVDIENNIIAVEFILVYHIFFLLTKGKPLKRKA